MEASEKLVILRGDKTQAEVADCVKISRSALGMYECGERTPRDEIKVRLANYYNISVQELFYSPNKTRIVKGKMGNHGKG